VLLELLAWQEIQINKLEQEILKLKGETTKPKIKPSKMDDDPAKNKDGNGDDGDKSKNLFMIFPLPIFPNSIWLKN